MIDGEKNTGNFRRDTSISCQYFSGLSFPMLLLSLATAISSVLSSLPYQPTRQRLTFIRLLHSTL